MKKLIKTLLGLFIIANTPTLADNIKYSGGIEIKVNGSTIFEIPLERPKQDKEADDYAKLKEQANTNLNVFLEGRSEEYGIKLNVGTGVSLLPLDTFLESNISLEDINITGKVSRYNLIEEGDELSFKLGKEKKQLVLGLDLCKMIGNTDFSFDFKIREGAHTPSFKFSKIRNSYLPKNGSITIGGGFSKTSSGHMIDENLNIAYNDIEKFLIKGFKGTYAHEYLPKKTKLEGGITLDVKNKSFPWLENIDITLGCDYSTVLVKRTNWYLGFVFPFKRNDLNMSFKIQPTFNRSWVEENEISTFPVVAEFTAGYKYEYKKEPTNRIPEKEINGLIDDLNKGTSDKQNQA